MKISTVPRPLKRFFDALGIGIREEPFVSAVVGITTAIGGMGIMGTEIATDFSTKIFPAVAALSAAEAAASALIIYAGYHELRERETHRKRYEHRVSSPMMGI